jgi:hypothetical protein
MNYYYGIAQDLTCSCSSLLSLSIIWINVSFIMKLMLSISPYHTIYLIVKLLWINLMLIRLGDCFISIGPFIDGVQLLHESQTSSLTQLSTKYHNKTHVLLNITNLASSFNPKLLEIFHPSLCNWGSKTMITNFCWRKELTLHLIHLISNFEKKQPPMQPMQPCALIIPYSNMKLLKTPSSLTTLEYP